MATATPAVAEVIDNYCSPSGDYCTRIVEKASGTFVFKIVAFADYFGEVDACVTKDTEACETVRPREGNNDLFTWKIAWQARFPDEGTGRYTLRWFDEGQRIGPPLHFRVR
jgi:hypothetical protein